MSYSTPVNTQKHKLTPEAKQDRDKFMRTDHNAVFDIEDFPMLPPPVDPDQVPKQQPNVMKASPPPCLCGVSMPKMGKIKCAKCTLVWHSDCVGLKGVTEYLLTKLENKGWNCPKCFVFSDVILEAFKADNINIEPADLDKVGFLINQKINAIIPKVISGVEKKIKEGCFDNVFKDAGRVVSNSWAEIARRDQNHVIKEAVQATTDVALQQSMKLLDANLTERKKRVRNVIISNVPENSTGANLAEVICDILGEGLRKEYILSCHRLGKKGERPRAILCVLLREDDAVFFSNDGKGRKFPGEVWVNPDLTRTERDVLYQKRMERRTGNRRNTTDPPLINLEGGVLTSAANRDSEEQTMTGVIHVEAEVHNVDSTNEHELNTDVETPEVIEVPQLAASVSNEHLNQAGVGNNADK